VHGRRRQRLQRALRSVWIKGEAAAHWTRCRVIGFLATRPVSLCVLAYRNSGAAGALHRIDTWSLTASSSAGQDGGRLVPTRTVLLVFPAETTDRGVEAMPSGFGRACRASRSGLHLVNARVSCPSHAAPPALRLPVALSHLRTRHSELATAHGVEVCAMNSARGTFVRLYLATGDPVGSSWDSKWKSRSHSTSSVPKLTVDQP